MVIGGCSDQQWVCFLFALVSGSLRQLKVRSESSWDQLPSLWQLHQLEQWQSLIPSNVGVWQGAAGQQAGSNWQKEGATGAIWVGGAAGFLFKGVGMSRVWEREEQQPELLLVHPHWSQSPTPKLCLEESPGC